MAIGPAGVAVAAAAAVSLTLAAVNAYLSGAVEMAAELYPRAGNAKSLQLAIAGVGAVVLAGAATGVLSAAGLVALPTALFLTVYLGCTAAAARLLSGATRVAAVLACAVVAVVLGFAGWATGVAALVVAAAIVQYRNEIRRIGRRQARNPLLMDRVGCR